LVIVIIVLIATCGYIFALDTIKIVKQDMAETTFLSIGMMLGFIFAISIIIKKSRMPLSAFGITTQNWRRAVAESLIFSAAAVPLIILVKYLLLQSIPGLEDKAVLELSRNAPYSGLTLFFAVLGYSLFVPFQELIFRGGLQTSLQVFLTGKYRVFFAILLSNLLFSAGHIYVNILLALIAVPGGLLWGWLYYRHGTLIGACISHILVGNFVYLVLGINSFS
jgi:membrane protease YdiL (CAAX protease family)